MDVNIQVRKRELIIKEAYKRTEGMRIEVLERALTFAYDEYHSNGWKEVLTYFDEILYIVTGVYFYMEDIAYWFEGE